MQYPIREMAKNTKSRYSQVESCPEEILARILVFLDTKTDDGDLQNLESLRLKC